MSLIVARAGPTVPWSSKAARAIRSRVSPIASLGAAHGTTYSMDWVPELEARYGIRLMG